MRSSRTLHISHRGGSYEAPENTLFAFRRAVDLGTDMLELDVHATAEGEMVVCHDPAVDRTTDGTGRIETLPLAAIRELDAAHWFVPDRGAVPGLDTTAYLLRGSHRPDLRIPTLREVFEALPDVALTIEVKAGAPWATPYHAALATLIEEFDRHADVIVGSFHDTVLEPLRAHDARVRTSATLAEAATFWADGALPTGRRIVALQVPPRYEGVEVVTEDFLERAHARGLAVHVWTLDTEGPMRRFLALGVDGIMTDRPSLLRAVLNAGRSAASRAT